MDIKKQLLGLILCLAVVVSDCRYTPWAAGREYVYRFSAISVSDLPELGPQTAGVKYDAQLIVQCRDPSSILVKLVNVTAWNYHQDVAESWDELESNQLGSKVTIEGKAFLERPFVVRHREGLIDSMAVSQDEPIWSINMKKAIVSKLQLHVSGTRSIESASRNFAQGDDSDDVNAIFKVFESGVTGECETLYEIARLSDALIRSDAKLNPMPKLCADGTFFQVVKTKDYNKCRPNRPVYNVVAPGGWKCKPGGSSCGIARTRTSVSRYIACGSLESFTLLKATHQGELRTSPYAYDTEQLRARSLLKMTLHAVRPASSPPSSGWQLKDADMGLIVSSLTYSFSGSSNSWTMTDGILRTPPLQEADHLHQVTGGVDQRTALLHEIDRLVVKAVDQMDENQEQEAVDTIAAVALLIRYLDYKDITSLVQLDNHQQRTQLERTIVLDAVVAAGSNPAVMFLKDAIINHRLTVTEMQQAIAGFPLYVRTPTLELLNELFILLKATSTFPAAERSVYRTAMLSVSQLAHTACVNVTEARSRFPESMYGTFCSPHDPFVDNKLVALLAKEVNGPGSIEDKMAALTALGEIGHVSIIPILLPIIKAKGDHSLMVRMKAVIALHKIAHNSNEEVMYILVTTFQNPTEHSDVRMAAFTLLILANPPAYRWQRIAVSTWWEHSAQVASFVYTTLYTLAQNIQPLENLKEISQKAQIVLPLAKRVPLGLKYSFNGKWSQSVPERDAGAEFHTEMFNSEESIFPKSLYSRLSWTLGPYQFDVLELETYGENWKSGWDRMLAKFTGNSDDASSTINKRFREFDLHPDLRRLKKQLNAKNPIPAQDSGSADAFLHLSLMKAMHHFSTFDEAGLTDFIQKIMSTNGVTFRREFARHHWMPLMHAEVLVPNTLGFLVATRAQWQTLASFKGNAKVTSGSFSDLSDLKDYSTPSSTKNLGFEIDVKPTVVVKLVSTMSINVEFTKVLPVCGVDTHLTVKLPGRFTFGLEMDSWKLLAAWQPTSSAAANSLYHYRVRPFTALQTMDETLPVTLPNPADYQDVRAATGTLQTHQYKIGGKTGLKLEYSSRSELPASKNHRSVWEDIDSPATMLTNANFALLPVSLHPRSYRVTLDPTGSATKKMIFSLNIDAADKLDKSTQVFSAGSKSPAAIKEPVNRTQFLSTNIDQNIRRKLTKVLSTVPKGYAVHFDAKLNMESSSGVLVKQYGASFAGAYGTEGTKMAINAQLELPLNQEITDPFIFCIEGGGFYPRFQSLERRSLIETPLEAAWNANIGFGESCTDHQVTIDADLKRSDVLSRHVQDSRENRDCMTHESRGEFSHETCLAVKELATVFDEYNITVKYGHVAPVLLNATLGLEDWLKSKFYSHLSDKRVDVSNTDGQLRVVAKVQPSLTAVNLMIYKPHSNTFFNDLPLSDMANIIFPLSGKSSLSERIVDHTVSDGFAPICRLERNSITTFDKVQYNAEINDCDHVVLTAPGIDTLAVLVRQEVQHNKIITLLVGRDKLEVSANDMKIRYNDMDVTVSEDQPLEVHHTDQPNQGPSIGVYKVGPTAFKLSAHAYDIHIVADASSSVTVKAPRSFQGKMIGLCGNMDGEMVSELRDPQRCILSSGAVMASSYLLTDSQGKCSGMPDKMRAQLREEQNSCLNKDQRLDHESYSPSPRPTTSGGIVKHIDCFIRRTLVFTRPFDNSKCFSTSTIKECRASCKGVQHRPINIGFHCVTNAKLAEELDNESKSKPLLFMIGKKEDFRTTRYLPTDCQPQSNAAQVDSSFNFNFF